MDETPNLGLPYIMAAQAQKHVTHNEAIRALDAIVQLAVLDRDLSAPPSTPADGDRCIVGPDATGAWSGHVDQVAAFQDGAWIFYAPLEGWIAWVADENAAFVWDGEAWVALASGGGGSGADPEFDTVGIGGASGDDTNVLSLNGPASLFNHDGNGHQLKLNKNAAGDTGSVLFQTGFSGRAEMGLMGDDDYRFKVSPDGSAWHDAIHIARATGKATFPNSALVANPSLIVNGDGYFNVRSLSSNADDTYSVDRHIVLTQSNSVAVSVLSNVANGVSRLIRMTQSNASAQRLGMAYIFPARDSQPWRGRDLVLSGLARLSTGANIRYAILEWTGTADTVTSDVVASWTSGTYTAGNFFLSSNLTVAAVGSLTLASATLTDLTALTAAISGSCNNLVLMIWTEGTAAQNVTLDFRWKLEGGRVATPWVTPDRVLEKLKCAHHCWRIQPGVNNGALGLVGIAASTTICCYQRDWPVEMFGTPTLTYSDVAHWVNIAPTGGSSQALGGIGLAGQDNKRGEIRFTSSSAIHTEAQACRARTAASGGDLGWLQFEAEL